MIAEQQNRPSVVNAPVEPVGLPRLNFHFPFSERRVLLLTIDTLLVTAVAWLVDQSGMGAGLTAEGRYWLPVLLGGWWLLAGLNDLYDVPSSSDTTLAVIRLFVTGLTAQVVYVIAHALAPELPGALVFFRYLAPILLAVGLWRWLYALAFDRPPFYHRVLIIGGGRAAQTIAGCLRQGPGIKCKVTGYVDDAATDGDGSEDLPYLGQEADLPELVRRWRIHEVVVATEKTVDQRLFQLLVDCQAHGMRVSWMPDVYSRLYRRIPMEYIDPTWALYAMQGRRIFSPLQQLSKRLLDLVVVLAALPILLLIIVPVAIAIRLDSEGPAFYRQIRVGRANKTFCIFKFRTMFVDAEKDGRARWATEDDDRITRVGRLLRKSRLDELPQILNVLRGEMSLVGPRPERPEFIAELQEQIPFYRTRLMVKPGITGWAQVQYSYGSTTEDALIKLQHDFYYIQYWSFWTDLYILYRTVGVMLGLKGR